MIDLLIVKAAIGPPKPHHQSRLAHVAVRRFSTTKAKPTTTYIDSPLTGAQMEVRYTVEQPFDCPTAYVEISIPLASAIIGQNYVHAGLDSIRLEVQCAEHLVRLVLTTLAFSPDEINRFISQSEIQLCELTWHTPTASTKARSSLQRRTTTYFESMKEISSRHDVSVANVDYRRRNGQPGLLVTLKDGDEFRQYGKFDQALVRSKRGKQRYAVSAEMAAHRVDLLQSIETHVRNELRLCGESLKSFGLQHPRAWTSVTMRGAIDATWVKLGLSRPSVATDAGNAIKKQLSSEAQRTLLEYLSGNLNLKHDLPPYTFTRHRKAIKAFNGTEIDDRGEGRAVNPESLGYQLQYARRWEPKEHCRQLVLCEETAVAKVLDLQRGIAFIADGEIPDIKDAAELDGWLKRWKKFAENEHLVRPAALAEIED